MSHTDLSREGLLALVRQAYEQRDPVPEELVERMRTVVAAEAVRADADLDYELMLLVERSRELAGARGAAAAYTLRFVGEHVDLLVRTVAAEDGSSRLDSWIAPAIPMTVRAVPVPDDGRSWEVRADANGRFELVDLPPGLYRMFLTPDDPRLTPFGTPAFEI